MGNLLTSFAPQIHAIVIGATGGLGRAFVNTLADDERVLSVLALSRVTAGLASDCVKTIAIDIEDEASIEAAARLAADHEPTYQLVIVATGVLHAAGLSPEKSWKALSADALATAYRINTIGPALVAKHFLPLLDTKSKSVFACLSARVGSIEDNSLGGWHAYRSSKAGLNMILRTLSVELARRNPESICVGLHPGTVDTPLSKPFQTSVPSDKLFTPAYSVNRLISVINGLTSVDSGQTYAWDGQRIPF
ncbi:MAG: SDR family NAD(P)-dependent oxidoreductase [Pseudomonadota bacterium]|nr:SDR family NAD(P)-dependent oxidoreductase [Pseudomonadota bacterium]MEC8725673.1 SDR family NAD(P)-dependent oxidoreductase [Pseudomonadota bacterium]